MTLLYLITVEPADTLVMKLGVEGLDAVDNILLYYI